MDVGAIIFWIIMLGFVLIIVYLIYTPPSRKDLFPPESKNYKKRVDDFWIT